MVSDFRGYLILSLYVITLSSIIRSVDGISCSVVNASYNRIYLKSHSEYGNANYQNKYEACWIITADDSTSIVGIKQMEFQLEDGTSSCSKDSLTAYDSNTISGSTNIKFCGKDIFTELYSSSRYMYLRFKTNGSNRFKGFRLAVEQYDKLKYKSSYWKSSNYKYTENKNGDESLSGWEIAGIAVGTMFGIFIFTTFCKKRHPQQQKPQPAPPQPAPKKADAPKKANAPKKADAPKKDENKTTQAKTTTTSTTKKTTDSKEATNSKTTTSTTTSTETTVTKVEVAPAIQPSEPQLQNQPAPLSQQQQPIVQPVVQQPPSVPAFNAQLSSYPPTTPQHQNQIPVYPGNAWSPNPSSMTPNHAYPNQPPVMQNGPPIMSTVQPYPHHTGLGTLAPGTAPFSTSTSGHMPYQPTQPVGSPMQPPMLTSTHQPFPNQPIVDPPAYNALYGPIPSAPVYVRPTTQVHPE